MGVLREAAGLQRKNEHSTSGGGSASGKHAEQSADARAWQSARWFRHCSKRGRDGCWRNHGRGVSEHREAEECRGYGQGHEQDHGGCSEQGALRRAGDFAGMAYEAVWTCAVAVCFEEHTFSTRHAGAGEGEIQAEVRGTFLSSAVAAEAEICAQQRCAWDPDAESRRSIQQMLRGSPLPADRCAEEGDHGDPQRHEERSADEPSAAGRRGQRQDNGGCPDSLDSHRKRIPGMHHGTDRSACTTAL